MPDFFKKNKEEAQKLHRAILQQSRQPAFYTDWRVPDTVDGRFDSIMLHVFLVMHRLEGAEKEGARLSQALFDCVFVDMDRALREMGVGDLVVPKHMKRMMQAFKGRMAAYSKALEEGSLSEALQRNLYGTVENPDETVLNAVAQYVRDSVESLRKQPWRRLKEGDVTFVSLECQNNEIKSENEADNHTGMVAQG